MVHHDTTQYGYKYFDIIFVRTEYLPKWNQNIAAFHT